MRLVELPIALMMLHLVGCNAIAGNDSLSTRTEGTDAADVADAADAASDDGIDGESGTTCRAIVTPPSCPAKTVGVPGGCYRTYATDEWVVIDAFCFDLTPVTLAAYKACATSGKCPPVPTDVTLGSGDDPALLAGYNDNCNGNHPERGEHPINCVQQDSAATYCAAQGMRLPTNDEWEWAARGGDRATLYPWGPAPPKTQLCWSGVVGRDHTCPVGSFPSGDDSLGIHDLSGNVDEWTSTANSGDPDQFLVRGGNWFSTVPSAVGVAAAYLETRVHRTNGLGFRCALGP